MIKNEIGREKEEKPKGGITMKKLIILAMVVGMMGMAAGKVMAQASTDTGYINLLITPVYTVDLDISPTFYNFGLVSVQQSTCSVSALLLTNIGTVGFMLDKAVWDDDEWDITISTTVQNGFDLWALTDTGEPGQAGFNIEADYKFLKTGLGDATYTNLVNKTSTSQEDMDPEASRNLWFRLDMPKYVENVNLQTINVRLKATNK